MHTHTFASPLLGNTRTVWTATVGDLPARADATRPLLVLFDGDWYRNTDTVNAPGTLTRLVADGTLPPLAVAYVSFIDIPTRAVECPMHEHVPAFVADELLPWLRTDAFAPADRVAPDAAGTVLGGLSYSGLLVWWVMLQRPEIADRALCQSASFWSQENRPLREVAARRPAPKRWWIDVGRGETATDVQHSIGVLQRDSQLDVNRRMRDALRDGGHDVTYHEFDGGHDFLCWGRTLPMALTALMSGSRNTLHVRGEPGKRVRDE
ncbi:MAG: alpha/beta hydrolase [Planctomycetota bacterium]